MMGTLSGRVLPLAFLLFLGTTTTSAFARAELPQLELVTWGHERRVQEETVQNPVFDIKYEFQMDVNPAGSLPLIEEGIDELEAEIQRLLDEFLAQASTPPVNILGISSVQLGTACTPTIATYVCGNVESTVTVEILNELGEDVVGKATLDRVQVFIDQFNEEQAGSVVVTFMGPFFVETELVIELSPVAGEMDDTEIALVEGELFSILEPELAGGDPPAIDLETVEFLYQNLIPLETERRRRLDDEGRIFRNIVHTYVTGRCRGCSDTDMARKVNDAVDANEETLRDNLRQEGEDNGTDYFEELDSVRVVVAAANEPPDANPPDFVPEVDEDNDPYWIWIIFGSALGLLAVAFGILCYWKRKNRRADPSAKDSPYYGDAPDSGVVIGMDTYDTPDNPASLDDSEYRGEDYPMEEQTHEVVDNPNYQGESGEMAVEHVEYMEEGGSAVRTASLHSTGSYTGHPDSERNVFAAEDEIDNIYRPQQENPTDYYHPQP